MHPLLIDFELAIKLAFAAGGFVISVGAATHALLTKRDPRSAAAWVSLCVFFPVVGCSRTSRSATTVSAPARGACTRCRSRSSPRRRRRASTLPPST
jgi:hypothetical protein